MCGMARYLPRGGGVLQSKRERVVVPFYAIRLENECYCAANSEHDDARQFEEKDSLLAGFASCRGSWP